jgi:hypothetical protein
VVCACFSNPSENGPCAKISKDFDERRLPLPIAGKPLSAECVLIEIDDTISEEGDEIAPDGPPFEPGCILDIVRRRVQFIVV